MTETQSTYSKMALVQSERVSPMCENPSEIKVILLQPCIDIFATTIPSIEETKDIILQHKTNFSRVNPNAVESAMSDAC